MTIDLDALRRALLCLAGLHLDGLAIHQVAPGLIVVHDAGTELVALVPQQERSLRPGRHEKPSPRTFARSADSDCAVLDFLASGGA